MLQNWLQPIQPEKIEGFQSLRPDQLGKNIQCLTNETNTLFAAQIAIVGIGAESANAVRSMLYQLNFPFSGLKIIDLGNARKNETSFLLQPLHELFLSGICPIIISESVIFTLPQFEAYHITKKTVNITLIDEKIRYTPHLKSDNYFLHRILEAKPSHLFHCNMVGYQAHFQEEATIQYFEDRHFETVRMGKVRAAMEEVEPLIRDADLLSFNIAAIRQSDAPAQENASPSGFFVEEACLVSRYAGLSDKLSSVGFYGFLQELDNHHQTAQVVAQLIWYFIDGFYNRKQDDPNQPNHQLTEYLVDVSAFDTKVRFWKSNKSGRWWMQIPMKVKKKKWERHSLIPCSYNDYLTACNDDLPDRLMNAFKRFM